MNMIEIMARAIVQEDNRGNSAKEYDDYWKYFEDKYKLKYFRMAKATIAALAEAPLDNKALEAANEAYWFGNDLENPRPFEYAIRAYLNAIKERV